MAPQSDTRTLYVLVSSLAGTVLSFAASWIFVAHSVQPMVALGGPVMSPRSLNSPALYLFFGFSVFWLLTSTLIIAYSVF
jgi:hypothetical protein